MFKDMDLVEQVHIFGLSNTHAYGSYLSLSSLFGLIFNYEKRRLFNIPWRTSIKTTRSMQN